MKNLTLITRESQLKCLSEDQLKDLLICGLNFGKNDLIKASYENCIFFDCEFKDSELETFYFENCTFLNCELYDVNFFSAILLNCKVFMTYVESCYFDYSIFHNTNVYLCDFVQSWFNCFGIIDSKFSECSFEKNKCDHIIELDKKHSFDETDYYLENDFLSDCLLYGAS